jgi:spore germination cell wall hydrolase CwlJ-like protein
MPSRLLALIQRAFGGGMPVLPGKNIAQLVNASADRPSQPQDWTGEDVDVLARTAWGEARGEGDEGLAAVLHVIRNRHDKGNNDMSYAEVAKAPKQFSVWNNDSPNRPVVENLGGEEMTRVSSLVRDVLSGQVSDPTGGATHYHSTDFDPPPWANHATPTAMLGKHAFYRMR